MSVTRSMRRHLRRTVGLTSVALLALSVPDRSARGQNPRYDLLLSGGTVIDGTGAARYRADVAITGDRIAAVSRTPIAASLARRRIDATGLIVAPGFIDLHAHLEPLPRLPDAGSHVRQGVTLALGGPDGASPIPLGAYLDSISQQGLGLNVAYLAGHNAIRKAVLGLGDRQPNDDELHHMQALVAEAMRDGAFGLSTGLIYIPGLFSKTDEIVALAQIAADSGGIYTTHLRSYQLDAVREALEIGRLARIPVVLTHHKAPARGRAAETIALVDSARRGGIDVMMDVYPYAAGRTGLGVLMPSWALDGGPSALRERLSNSALTDSITRGVMDSLRAERVGGNLRNVQFSRVEWDATLEGKTLSDVAIARGLAPSIENGARIVVDAMRRGNAWMIYHNMDEGDVRRILAHAQTMIASDGELSELGEAMPHPRTFGTFPRVLGKYVRDERLLALEQAVHKMTAMPARRLGLADRGCIRQGCAADVTIFDAAAVRDVGSYEDPHHYPEGIPYVIVNGVPVVDEGRFTGARPGKVIRRPGASVRR